MEEQEEDGSEYSEYSDEDDEEETEVFSDEALDSFRLFMVRTTREVASSETTEGEVSDDYMIENEEPVEEETEEDAEEDEETDEETAEEDILAEVEDITAKLQGRGITMLDLVAMLTDRKSTKIAKHTDRFMNALDAILDNAIEDCDREAKERAQAATSETPIA